MIVRCKSCNSAFAVDDNKVENKLFAFSCPNCTTENVIDNRVAVKSEASISEGDNSLSQDAAFDLDSDQGNASQLDSTPDTDDSRQELVVEKTSDLEPDTDESPIDDSVNGLTLDTSNDVPLDDIMLDEGPTEADKQQELKESLLETPLDLDPSPTADVSAADPLASMDDSAELDLNADFTLDLETSDASETLPDVPSDLTLDETSLPEPTAEDKKQELQESMQLDDELGNLDLDASFNEIPETKSEDFKQEDSLQLDTIEVPKPEDDTMQLDLGTNDLTDSDLDMSDIEFDMDLSDLPEPTIEDKNEELAEIGETPIADGMSDGGLDLSDDSLNLDIELGDIPEVKVEDKKEELPDQGEKAIDDVIMPTMDRQEDVQSDELDLNLSDDSLNIEIPIDELPEPTLEDKQEELAEIGEPLTLEEDDTLDLSDEMTDLEISEIIEELPEPTEADKLEEMKEAGISAANDIKFDDTFQEDAAAISNTALIPDAPDESPDERIMLGEDIKSEEVYSKDHSVEDDGDESITIDLNSLDIELQDNDEMKSGEVPDEDTKLILNANEFSEELLNAETTEKPVDTTSDEDITLDLDTLDIELEDEPTIKTGEKPDDFDLTLDLPDDTLQSHTASMGDLPEPTLEDKQSEMVEALSDPKDDESITLDLDSLDIELSDDSEIKQGEIPEDDEKITLDDAGISIDELTGDEVHDTIQTKDDEEDIKLSLADIDPSLDIDTIDKDLDKKLDETDVVLSQKDDEKLLIDEVDEYGSIELDDSAPEVSDDSKSGIEVDPLVAGGVAAGVGAIGAGAALTSQSVNSFDDQAISDKKKHDEMLHEIETDLIEIDLDDDQSEHHVEKELHDFEPNGSISFSVDFSLKFSRIGAILRLLGIFQFILIPHYIVFFIYSILSSILGFINQLVVLGDNRTIEAFSDIQENTLRYLLYINASITGVSEDLPVYAGREDLNHSLQMKVTHPFKHSKLIALLRLSGLGLFIILLPHYLILLLMTLAVPVIYIIDLISIIISTRRIYILFDFMNRYYRYLAKISAFAMGLIDKYPNFKFM